MENNSVFLSNFKDNKKQLLFENKDDSLKISCNTFIQSINDDNEKPIYDLKFGASIVNKVEDFIMLI